MARKVVTVVVPLAQWACSDVEPAFVLDGGRHEIAVADLDPAVQEALGHAIAAGSVVLAEGEHARLGTVEDDETSLRAYERAQEVRAELVAERDADLSRVRSDIAARAAEHGWPDEKRVAELEKAEAKVLAAHEEAVQERLA